MGRVLVQRALMVVMTRATKASRAWAMAWALAAGCNDSGYGVGTFADGAVRADGTVSNEGGASGDGSDAATAGATDAGANGVDGSVVSGVDPSAAKAAADTARDHADCQAIAPFYWEIGDRDQVLVSGAVASAAGSESYGPDSSMQIASASKLVFGAYVFQRLKANLADVDVKALTMCSGYSGFRQGGCARAQPSTVQGCFDGGIEGQSVPDPSTVDSFAYGGGHFQKYAIELGLGDLDNAGLAAEYAKVLGEELELSFSIPLLAGGMQATPRAYAKFLRKILAGKLAIADHLGEQAVCTLPAGQGGTCQAISSPAAPYAWHYSYGHWVEDDASRGDDGSFSSAGAFGFYPWIDAEKKHYGIVARKSDSAFAGMDSARCGARIRKAFTTGQAAP